MRMRFWGCLLVAGLIASRAGAAEYYVPVPHLGGKFVYGAEFVRQDLSKDNVDFTFVEEGARGLGRKPARYRVLPGPTNDPAHPLLTDNYKRDYTPPPGRSNPKFHVPGGGLVILKTEPGIVAAEAAVSIGVEPAAAWELPVLRAKDAFPAGETAYLSHLMQGGGISSQLSIFNIDRTAAQCTARLRTSQGQFLDERTNVAVPALGSVRIADIVSRVVVGRATDLNVTVSCNRAFYTLGSFPSPVASYDIRVHYPSSEPPPGQSEWEILVRNGNFQVTPEAHAKRIKLPLEKDVRYRFLMIDFNVIPTSPADTAYLRSLVAMWRPEPSLRFGRQLFFGTAERFDRGKLLIDLGTPYLKLVVKRGQAALAQGQRYHFHIEVDAEQKTLRQLVTASDGTVVADMITGLFNDDLVAREGKPLTLGFGLTESVDPAFSPPYGWRFSRIVVSGYR